MKRAQTVAGVLSERLMLPGELLGETKLSVVGQRRALIENHRGLLLCTPELISVRGGKACLSLRGTELRIEAMNEKELLICGRISFVEWDG